MSKGPKVPQPFNPMQVSGAQTASNIQTALANARLGAVNQVTPYGTVSYQFGTPPPKAANTPMGAPGSPAPTGAPGGQQQQPMTYAQRVMQRLVSGQGAGGQGGGGGY